MGELAKLYAILVSFLGESKNGFDGVCMQLQFPCPNCIDKYGSREIEKYNLEVNLAKGKYHCWKCNAEDDHMSGSIYNLIRKYGNDTLLKEYKEIISSIRDSEFYQLKFDKDSFVTEEVDESGNVIKLPNKYVPFEDGKEIPQRVLDYVQSRGLNMSILTKHKMGYILYDNEKKILSNRIILPSYGIGGELNYWTGRDFTKKSKQKYFNIKAERKDIIFNESLIQWDADITLVEGPFDHIVVPNSIPLLGKVLTKDYKLYQKLIERANAHINVFLDGDAPQNAIDTYKLLAHGRLLNQIRLIKLGEKEDPSSVFQNDGYRGIANKLASGIKLKEVILN